MRYFYTELGDFWFIDEFPDVIKKEMKSIRLYEKGGGWSEYGDAGFMLGSLEVMTGFRELSKEEALAMTI